MKNEFKIYPTCPKCGHKFTIKLKIVDRLKAEIVRLKKQIADRNELDALNSFKNIFGGFGK